MEVRRTVTGFAALGAATLFAQVAGFLVLAYVTRRVAPDQVGAFTFALALAGYFGIPANLGVTTLAVRDLVRRPDDARDLLGEVLALQAVLGLAPYALLVVLAPLLAADEASRSVIPIVALGFLLEALTAQWVLYGRQRFSVLAAGRALGAIAYAAVVLATVRDGSGAQTLAWTHVAGVGATALLLLPIAVRVAGGRPTRWAAPRELVRRFRAGVPMGVAAVMTTIYYTADQVMLGWIAGTATVGQYAIAYKLPLAVLALAALWGAVLLPHMAALAVDRRDELREQLGWFLSLSLVVSLPLLAGSIAVGGDLMPQLFGDRYGPAGTPFVLLMAVAALVLLTMSIGTALIALGDERQSAYAVTVGAAVNIALNLALIPPFGMEGAAVATIAAEVAVFAYLSVRVRRLLGLPPLEQWRIGRAAGATAAMVAVLLLAPAAWSAVTLVALGTAVFAVLAVALRVVHPDEVRKLLSRPAAA